MEQVFKKGEKIFIEVIVLEDSKPGQYVYVQVIQDNKIRAIPQSFVVHSSSIRKEKII